MKTLRRKSLSVFSTLLAITFARSATSTFTRTCNIVFSTIASAAYFTTTGAAIATWRVWRLRFHQYVPMKISLPTCPGENCYSSKESKQVID